VIPQASISVRRLTDSVVLQIWDHILKTRNTAQLNRFVAITFADLKKYKYYYWFAFPAFAAKPAWEIGDEGWTNAGDLLGQDGVCSFFIVWDCL